MRTAAKELYFVKLWQASYISDVEDDNHVLSDRAGRDDYRKYMNSRISTDDRKHCTLRSTTLVKFCILVHAK